MVKKREKNPTLRLMEMGLMRFKRRVDFPMWHPDHISKIANIMREYAERIEAVHGSNSLRSADKTLCAQRLIVEMNAVVQTITPRDPRTRGAERLQFGDYGLIDHNGFNGVKAHKDLQE